MSGCESAVDQVSPDPVPRLAMVVTLSMVVAGAGTLPPALRSTGVLLLAWLSATVLTWAVAAAYVAIAAGWIRRRW